MVDFVKKISFLRISDAIKWVKVYSPDDASGDWIDIDIQKHIVLGRESFPDLCYTLDITNNRHIQQIGISQLRVGFHSLKNSSVQIHVEGKNVACNRNLKAHTFYSSGDQITLIDMNIPKKTFLCSSDKRKHIC